jgi:hypothetical protein
VTIDGPPPQPARRDKKITALRKQLRQIDTTATAHAKEIIALADGYDPDSPAVKALRARNLAIFTDLEKDRLAAEEELATLVRQQTPSQDPALLDLLDLLPCNISS